MVKTFKRGDRVRRTVQIGHLLKRGEVYRVERVTNDPNGTLILEGYPHNPFYSRYFDLAGPAIEIGDKMFKVINNNVQGKPTVLRTFDTQSEAEEYAETMITGQAYDSVSICQELIRMERKIEVSRVPV